MLVSWRLTQPVLSLGSSVLPTPSTAAVVAAAEDIDFPSHIHTLVGFDFERSNYDLIRHLKCQPWWNNYYNTQVCTVDVPNTLPRQTHSCLLHAVCRLLG
eukprot:GHRR01030650.1.p1 GENE.GHRR01030650.1~~GHRR01030650.1.p1  ORF type:complete len:100 (-),score=3.53 GHRR01030650.1:820-1119(-)